MATKRASKKVPLKSSKPAKAPKPKQAAAAKRAPRELVTVDAADSPAVRTAKALLAKLAPLSSATRAAFRKLATDTQRAKQGTRTHSHEVVGAAASVAVDVAKQTAKVPAIGDDYTPARFAYFLESILALDAARGEQASEEATQGAARSTATTGRAAALVVRKKLEKRLLRYAGRRKDVRDAVKEASGRATTATDLQRSLGALGNLATGYLALTDESSRILARESGLTQALVDEARAASETAADTSAGAAAEGDAHASDAPLVNIAEGTVLIEMAHALDVFDELADTLPGTKRLVIHSAPIRKVVEGFRHAAPDDTEPPADPPAPPGPPPPPPPTPPAD